MAVSPSLFSLWTLMLWYDMHLPRRFTTSLLTLVTFGKYVVVKPAMVCGQRPVLIAEIYESFIPMNIFMANIKFMSNAKHNMSMFFVLII